MPDIKDEGAIRRAKALRRRRKARGRNLELRPQGRWEGVPSAAMSAAGDAPGGGRGACSVARACLEAATPGELGWRVHGEAMEI